MKAIVYYKYGSPEVLKLEEVEKPVPRANQVLVKVHAVSLNGSDCEGLRGKPLYARMGGFQKPLNKILGSDISGRVEGIGKNVTQFRLGDEVFGEMLGYGGGFAEYACTSEKTLALKPAGISFEEAAAIPQAAVIALQGLRDKAQVQPGQSILINGGGGSAGTFAVQLAKLYGAEVTGVDNQEKLDFMRLLGADHVVDYQREDFSKLGNRYDLILDVIAHRSIFNYQRVLRPNGRCFIVGGSLASMLQALILGPWMRRITGKRISVLVVNRNREDLIFMAQLCMKGKIVPVIDRRYPLNEVPEALRYLGEGHAKGKIVITMEMSSLSISPGTDTH